MSGSHGASPPQISPLKEGLFKDIKDVWDRWNIRGMIILSLSLQTILILVAPSRRRTSRTLVAVLVWLSYLLADWAANYTVAQITKNQGKDPKPGDPLMDKKLMALWTPFLLLHLGGPDAITALALEDNALWHRHLFSLVFQLLAGGYAVALSLPNPMWIPAVLLFVTGVIRYGERTLALYKASLDRFRDSLMKAPDPGPNYAKLMEEYEAKQGSRLPTKIVRIEEPDKHQRPPTIVKPKNHALSHLEIVQYAFRFFNTFKGLVVNLIFSFRERDETQGFFDKLEPEEALRIIEVELGFFYDALYTKTPVLHSWFAVVFRVVALGSFLAAFCKFHYRPRKSQEFHGADVVITYFLFAVGIFLDFVSILVYLVSDWTFAVLSQLRDDPYQALSFKDITLNKILAFRALKWQKQECCDGVEHEILATPFLLRRWSGNLHAFNFVAYCMKTHVKPIHEVKSLLDLLCKPLIYVFRFFAAMIQGLFRSIGRGIDLFHKSMSHGIERWSRKNQVTRQILSPLRIYVEFWIRNPHFTSDVWDWIVDYLNVKDLIDRMRFVYSERLTLNQWRFIFNELREKSHFADTPDNAKRISSARGEWALRHTRSDKAETSSRADEKWSEDHGKLMQYVSNAVDYDQSLLMWHIATELCYQAEDEEGSTEKNCDAREFSKVMSDYMMYLLIMQPKLMSEVAGIGKIRFRDTMAEARKLMERRHVMEREVREACRTISSISTDVEPVDVKGDRSKSVLFEGSSLAKQLKLVEEKHKVNKWMIMSRVWVELLSYAACRCEATAHVKQLSRGGELINFVWLLMAHFGLGDQFQINQGDARAKLVVGK